MSSYNGQSCSTDELRERPGELHNFRRQEKCPTGDYACKQLAERPTTCTQAGRLVLYRGFSRDVPKYNIFINEILISSKDMASFQKFQAELLPVSRVLYET